MVVIKRSWDVGGPLEKLDDWDDFVVERYPEGEVGVQARRKGSGEAFRDYRAEARPGIKEFYRLNHSRQTLEFVKAKKKEYLGLDHKLMGVWEAIELLDTLMDDSDPDTELSQLEHLLQTAEAIRGDGHPRWLILAGLVHDLGKLLCVFGEPQWAVVGDTFAVGCEFSDKVIFPEFFESNPDSQDERYQTAAGIYEEGCGLDQVHLSWGHDEYLYQVLKEYLPDEALYPIRYHSFYACHREGASGHLMNDRDREMFRWVRTFNPYDLYSKDENPPAVKELRPFYQELVAEYLPARLRW